MPSKAPFLLVLLFPTLFWGAEAFSPVVAFGCGARKAATLTLKTTALKYANYSHAVTEAEAFVVTEDLQSRERRDNLKNELAKCSIENYDIEAYNSGAMIAEDIMKELEHVRPWVRPAEHPGLNARFSFVFTGVPTIGMRLITLLSRISIGFPIVDFSDVFLEVSEQNTKAKAIVSFKIFGIPFELNVNTNLCADETCPEGTMMIEQFQGITLQGFPVPTPESWHNSRTMEVSYLDEDMMIARTGGGEPHFLLRHSSCSTDDDSCDIDTDLSDYFVEARAKYGEKIARCLVDREFGRDNECGDRTTNPLATILSLKPGSLLGGNGREPKNKA